MLGVREGLQHKRRPHKVTNIILLDEIPRMKPEQGSNPRVHSASWQAQHGGERQHITTYLFYFW